ncbi:MAG: alpha/beta fold hydrolase [Allorhizobium sp.]
MTTKRDAGFISRTVTTTDGLSLHVRDYGAGLAGRPVVCLPGLTRNARDFHQLALRLSGGAAPRRVIAIDSRGRGLSDHDPDKSRYTIGVEAEDVLTVLDALKIDMADFIGTSRGGLILHLLAVSHPERLGRVVLNDIGPVLEVEGLRQIQDYLRRESAPKDFDEAAKRLRAVHGAAFPALSPADWQDMAEAIYREIGGKLLADFDPAIASQFAAADLSQPLADLWANFAGFSGKPLMTIRGETSRLLSQETLAEMGRRHGTMASVTAAGQGHAPVLHLGRLDEAIAAFLGR